MPDTAVRHVQWSVIGCWTEQQVKWRLFYNTVVHNLFGLVTPLNPSCDGLHTSTSGEKLKEKVIFPSHIVPLGPLLKI